MGFRRKKKEQKQMEKTTATASSSPSSQRVDDKVKETTPMASASPSAQRKESSEPNCNSAKSGFRPTVCLKDWWLIRTEADSQGRTLAVAGLTSLEHHARRVFRSAPIVMVYDAFTLETVDGVCVVLSDFINKARTLENGFPSEVFKHILFGFPPQWEVFNKLCLGRKSEEGKDVSNVDQKDRVEATAEEIQEDYGKKDYAVEDNSERDNQNDREVVSEVIAQKKTNKAVRYFHKRNSANTSTRIAKKQTADDSRMNRFKIGSASAKNTKRRLAYESPRKEQKTDSAMSPEPLSFSRSRSGRLLLPPMAFWRNERAIYDASHSVTAVKQADLDLDNLCRVSRSEPSRKRRQLR